MSAPFNTCGCCSNTAQGMIYSYRGARVRACGFRDFSDSPLCQFYNVITWTCVPSGTLIRTADARSIQVDPTPDPEQFCSHTDTGTCVGTPINPVYSDPITLEELTPIAKDIVPTLDFTGITPAESGVLSATGRSLVDNVEALALECQLTWSSSDRFDTVQVKTSLHVQLNDNSITTTDGPSKVLVASAWQGSTGFYPLTYGLPVGFYSDPWIVPMPADGASCAVKRRWYTIKALL